MEKTGKAIEPRSTGIIGPAGQRNAEPGEGGRRDHETEAARLCRFHGRELMTELFRQGLIDARYSPLFDTAVPGFGGPRPRDGSSSGIGADFLGGLRAAAGSATHDTPSGDAGRIMDKVEGMLVGIAIGDSLGNTTESMLPAARQSAHGEIRGYLPNRSAGGKAAGLPSDDTQLSFITVRSLLEKGPHDPEALSYAFSAERIVGIGGGVKEFIRNRKDGVPWYRAGSRSAGNGALMRVAPLLLPTLREGGTGIWADLVLGSMITHNDSASIASCVAFGVMLRELLAMRRPPEQEWWPERFVEIAAAVETERRYGYRGGRHKGTSATISECVRQHVPEAIAGGRSVRKECDTWYSGAYLLETIPAVLLILGRYGHDPEEAVVRAVNDTKDNDTIASIVGAAVGALHGIGRIPERWIRGLSGWYSFASNESVRTLATEAVRVFL